MKEITIIKGAYNAIPFSFAGDLTNQTVTYRVKRTVEDSSQPLIQNTVSINSTSAFLSTGAMEIDLSATDLKDLIGNYYIDFKITPANDPSKSTYSEIFSLLIRPTLKV